MPMIAIKDDATLVDLRIYCAKTGKKIYEAVEEALRDYLNKHK